MGTQDGVMIVLSNPTEGNEATFNEWYETVHVPEVLAVPGVVAARRFSIAQLELPEVEGIEPPPPPAHRYLVIYELDRPGNEVMAELGNRLVSGEMSLHEALDMSTIGVSAWDPITTGS